MATAMKTDTIILWPQIIKLSKNVSIRGVPGYYTEMDLSQLYPKPISSNNKVLVLACAVCAHVQIRTYIVHAYYNFREVRMYIHMY